MRDMTPGKVRRKRRPKVADLPELPVADEVYSDTGSIDPVLIPADKDVVGNA